ncbi:MAG: ABC transporter permease [Candidatus Metalachnospira sp.]|nr:ABC transporter permease [Candidatus Metalachnospira sp.]
MKILVQKQDNVSSSKRIINVLVCILLAMAFCAIFIFGYGENPLLVYQKMLFTAFGSLRGISNSIVYAIPLMLCGLGVSVAFKMGINNIGAEGQYTMGAFAAAGVALYCDFIPQNLVIPMMILASFAAGATWGVIAIIPKALWGVNETIVTLMMNYIAILFVDYLCFGPWIDKEINLPVSKTIPDYAKLKNFFGTNINAGVLIAIICAVIIYVFFKYTAAGYQIKVISKNINSAQYAGLGVVKKIILVMLVSGGIAGMTGFAQISGQVYKLQTGIANNAGFTGIVIAYLSKFNPFVVLLVSVFFGGLTIGGFSVQTMGIPPQVVTMLQGAILIFVLGGELVSKYKLTFVKNSKIKKEIKEMV